MGLDRLVGVDSLVAEGDVDVAVPGDDLGDVRREAVHDGVGDEHPAEVVGCVKQRGRAGIGQSGAGEGAGEHLADGGGGDRAVLGADTPLEQQRGGRQPQAFVVVVGGDERHGVAGAADPADDGAEHVGELGADDQQPLGVGFGRDDLQQRHQLAGAGEPVLHEAVMAELHQFLNADAGERRTSTVAQAQNARSSSAVRSRRFPVAGSPAQILAVALARPGAIVPGLPAAVMVSPGLVSRAACSRSACGLRPVGGADQDGQDREPFAGPGVHPRLAVPLDLALDGFLRADGAGSGPRSPPCGVIDGPLGQVEVEGPDRGQELAVADPPA